MTGARLAKLINCRAEATRRPEVMQEDDDGLHVGHVVVDGDDIDAVPPQRFEHRRELRLQHGNVSGNHRVSVRVSKRGPRVQTHARIDRGAVVARVDVRTADRDLTDGAGLLTRVADCFLRVRPCRAKASSSPARRSVVEWLAWRTCR
jgi:hypothetical protein